MISSLGFKVKSGVSSLTSICYHHLGALVHVRKGLEDLGVEMASVTICVSDKNPEDCASNHLTGEADWFEVSASMAQLLFNLGSDLVKVVSLFISHRLPSGMPTAHHG